MRKNFGSQTWLYPMPVLIVGTYNPDDSPNAMNAAWGGIHDTGKLGICIDPGHRTARNLQQRKAFTVSLGDAPHMVACDYVGIVSGNDRPDKFARAGFHAVRSEFVDAPIIAELPLTLECRLLSFDPETGCTVGEIVNVSAEERILDAEGRIDPDQLQVLTFDPVHHTYRKLGEIVGTAFQDGRKLR